MRTRLHRPARRIVTCSVFALAAAAVAAPVTASADESLTVTTPYPAIEAQPGSSVTLDVTVTSAAPEVVDLELTGLPDGWTATLRGGGFVIRAITSEPDDGATADLEIAVPPTAEAGEYDITVVASDATGGRAVVPITVIVAEQVDSGISLSADFPSLSGEPGSELSYSLTVDNQTPIEQTFTFDPSGPQGWTVTANPTAQERAQTVTIEAGGTSTVRVSATPPPTAAEGSYPIDVAVIGENGARGAITLEAIVTGTAQLTLATADDRLDVSGAANSEKRIPMIIANTGTAALESVNLAGTAPSGWDVSFEPTTVELVEPGETAQVTAVVKPAAESVAGDYALTVRASAGSLSSNTELRYSLEGSRTLGFVAIGVIAAAFLVLAGVFVRYGRR